LHPYYRYGISAIRTHLLCHIWNPFAKLSGYCGVLFMAASLQPNSRTEMAELPTYTYTSVTIRLQSHISLLDRFALDEWRASPCHAAPLTFCLQRPTIPALTH